MFRKKVGSNMYCKYCGSKLMNNAKFCTNCGNNTEIEEVKTEIVENKVNNTGSETAALVLGIISLILFFIPVIGLILGIISLILGSNYKKKTGKSVGFALGLAGTILNVVFTLFILLIVFIALVDTADNDYYKNNNRYYHTERYDGYM